MNLSIFPVHRTNREIIVKRVFCGKKAVLNLFRFKANAYTWGELLRLLIWVTKRAVQIT